MEKRVRLYVKFAIFGLCAILLIEVINIKCSSAQDEIDTNLENFQNTELVWEPAQIQTTLTKVTSQTNHSFIIGLDSYRFSDDTQNNILYQVTFTPISDYQLNLQYDNTSYTELPTNTLTVFHRIDVQIRDNNRAKALLFNQTFTIGSGNDLQYKRIVVRVPTTDALSNLNYSIHIVAKIEIEINIDSYDYVVHENDTLVASNATYTNIVPRIIVRETNPFLDGLFKTFSSDYFEVVLFGLVIFLAYILNPNRKKQKDPNQVAKKAFPIPIAFSMDLIPNKELQQTIRPYLLFMFIPIPFIFLAPLNDFLGYFSLMFLLNFVPMIVILIYLKKKQKLMSFKNFMKIQLICIIPLFAGGYVLILSVAFTIFGFLLDSMQLVLYLITYGYLFGLVYERKQELEDTNSKGKRVIISIIMLSLAIVLIFRYFVPLLAILFIQSDLAFSYPMFFQYQLQLMQLGLKKIRWDMGIGGILMLIYILNEFQINYLKTYNPKEEQKFLVRFILLIYLVIYIMSTMIITNLQDSEFLTGYLSPHSFDIQKGLVKYSDLVYLYPHALYENLRQISSSNIYPFSNNPWMDIMFTNFIVIAGIFFTIPQIYFFIFTHPGKINRLQFYQSLNLNFRSFIPLTFIFSGIITFAASVTAMEVGFILFFVYFVFLLSKINKITQKISPLSQPSSLTLSSTPPIVPPPPPSLVSSSISPSLPIPLLWLTKSPQILKSSQNLPMHDSCYCIRCGKLSEGGKFCKYCGQQLY